MNWLKNITNKSSDIFQAYKEGMKEFVGALKEDIETVKITRQQDEADPEEEKTEDQQTANEPTETTPISSIELLLKQLNRFFKEEQLKDLNVNEIAESVKSNMNDILKKDPLGKVLAQRTDFTNFPNFFEKFKGDAELPEAILTFVPTLPQTYLEQNPQIQQKDTTKRLLLRFFYVLVYEIDFKIRIKEKRKRELANSKELKFTEESPKTESKKKEEVDDDWQIEEKIVGEAK